MLLEFETATARELVKMGARHGWTVIDAASAMDGRSEWFAEDLIHFNEAGAAEVARLIARGNLTGTHALQQLHLPLRVSADHLRRVLGAADVLAAIRLAGRHRLRVLRLLESAILAADGVLDAGQLRGRPGISPLERPSAAATLPRDSDRRRSRAARLLQVHELPARFRP